MNKKKCPTCGKDAHDFLKEEAFNCVPPKEVLRFGDYEIDKKYRKELYNKFPLYNTEEIVGTYLGHNPHYPSQDKWINDKE